MKLYKTILSSSLFFLMLFGVKLAFIPVGLSKFLMLFLLVYYLMHISKKQVAVKFPRRIIYALVALSILFLYAAFITIFNGINDFQYGSKLLFILYEPILGGFLLSYFVINYFDYDLSEVLASFSNAIFFQAILTVCAYVVPGINDLFNTLLPNLGNIDNTQITRVRGFTNLGGAWLSVILAIAVILNLYFFGQYNRFRSKMLSLFKIIICMAATFVTGRTGLLLSIMSVGVFCCYWLFWLRRPREVGGFFLPILLLAALVYFYLPAADEVINQDTINWALEIFLKSGSGSTDSSEDLKSMLYLPSNVYHLIFGIGFYESGVMFYPRSDSGYVKTIFSVGILGSILFYSIFIYYFRLILYYISRLYGQKEFFLFLFLFIVFLMIEVKEPYFQSLGVTNFVFFWFFYLDNRANRYEQS